jgi:polysaccharide chain length determinant protein (PEP-CTERM system associated)
MAELSEEQDTGRFDLQRYISIVRRRHVYFLVPLLIGWLAVWGASWVLPARYKSGTLILVEQPTMPTNYVTPNVADDLQDRLQSITQQILSRTRLLLIINKLHIYEGQGKQISDDEKVELMRKDIDIQLEHDTHNSQITAFRIYYSARDPRVAQKVTSELTDLFIKENTRVRQQESQDTTNFIASQLENARQSLAEQEAKVQEFEGQHEGALPSQQASNMQILSGLQAQLQNEQDSLNAAKQQRIYFQSLIEQYRAVHGTTRAPDGTPMGLQAIDQELASLKAQLADLGSHYTDRHPDVQSLKVKIAKTEKRREEYIASLKNKGSNGVQSADSAAEAAQNPQLVQLQGQLQANQAEIANREQAISSLKGRIGSYQGRLNEEPVREQEMADLTRGYEQSKANYDDLLKKKNESEMATSMEQMQQGERFSILDPPSLPVKPDFPNRLKFCGIGVGVGFVLGLLLAGGFEALDDRLHSEQEIKSLLPVAAMAEIPEIVSPSDERTTKRKMALGWAMAGVVFTVILAGSAFSFLHN